MGHCINYKLLLIIIAVLLFLLIGCNESAKTVDHSNGQVNPNWLQEMLVERQKNEIAIPKEKNYADSKAIELRKDLKYDLLSEPLDNLSNPASPISANTNNEFFDIKPIDKPDGRDNAAGINVVINNEIQGSNQNKFVSLKSDVPFSLNFDSGFCDNPLHSQHLA